MDREIDYKCPYCNIHVSTTWWESGLIIQLALNHNLGPSPVVQLIWSKLDTNGYINTMLNPNGLVSELLCYGFSFSSSFLLRTHYFTFYIWISCHMVAHVIHFNSSYLSSPYLGHYSTSRQFSLRAVPCVPTYPLMNALALVLLA